MGRVVTARRVRAARGAHLAGTRNTTFANANEGLRVAEVFNVGGVGGHPRHIARLLVAGPVAALAFTAAVLLVTAAATGLEGGCGLATDRA
jgi:hypothetical protein